MIINDFGWDDYFQDDWNLKCTENMFPARIISDYGQKIRVISNDGESLINKPIKKDELQTAVGDWIALEYESENKTIQVKKVLNRKTKLSRAAAGPKVKEQIIAANVDTVFLIQSLNDDFNMRRLERYLIAAWESGAMPVVILTKTDCCNDVEKKVNIAGDTALGVNIHAICAITGEGLNEIKQYMTKGKTTALLGSSGVGKSTLVNILSGKKLLKTQEIRQNNDRGRHTTNHRELYLLPGGGLILDTPGMRSLALWEADAGINMMFSDIDELAYLCKFRDCRHQNEPDCAVKKALEDGNLDMSRWKSWQKLQKELKHIELKKQNKIRMQEKNFSKMIKAGKVDKY